MWHYPFLAAIPMVPMIVTERVRYRVRMRRSYLEHFPPTRRHWTVKDVEGIDHDILHGALEELVELREDGMHEFGWKQSANMITQELWRQGWGLDDQTLELVPLIREERNRHRSQERPQRTLEDRPLQCLLADGAHNEESDAETQRSQEIRVRGSTRPADIHIHLPEAPVGRAGPAYPAQRSSGQKKKQSKPSKVTSRSRQYNSKEEYESGQNDCRPSKSREKSKVPTSSKSKNKSRHRRPPSESEEESESECSDREADKSENGGKSKATNQSKNRSRLKNRKSRSRPSLPPPESGDEEEPESDYSNRGRSKVPKQSKSRRRVREPEYSVFEYESESSEPATKPRQQKLIKNEPEYIVPGFDEDYAPASDFELARSDEEEHASEMMRKPWGGPSKEKKRDEKQIARRR